MQKAAVDGLSKETCGFTFSAMFRMGALAGKALAGAWAFFVAVRGLSLSLARAWCGGWAGACGSSYGRTSSPFAAFFRLVATASPFLVRLGALLA